MVTPEKLRWATTTTFEKEPERLRWVVDVREPIRLVVSEEQALAVRTVASCVRSWLIHDHAMKWWPGLWLRDLQDHPAGGAVRHTVARMWWIYAVHRVLAQRHKRATGMLMDAMWRGMNLSYYKELLRDMAHCRRPHRGYVPNASLKALQPYKAEARQVKDLQLLLPLEDIIAQRRRAISAAPPGAAAGAPAAPTPCRTGALGAQERLQRLGESSMDQIRRFRSGLSGLPRVADPDDLDLEAAAAAVVGPQVTVVGAGPQAAAAGEELASSESSPQSGRRTASLLQAVPGISQEGGAFWLGHFAGDWEVNVPAVELLVFAGETAGARLLHGKLENLFADAHVEAQAQPGRPGRRRASAEDLLADAPPAADAEQPGRPCLFALSVGSFALTSPDGLDSGGDSLYGAPPEVVRVARPLELGEPSSDDMQAAQDLIVPGRGRGLIGPDRADESLERGEGAVLAAFAALDCGGSGVCEVHLADLNVVVSDVLLRRLKALAGLGEPGGAREDAGGEGGRAGGGPSGAAGSEERRSARRSFVRGHRLFQRVTKHDQARAMLAASYSTLPSSRSRSDGDAADAGSVPARSSSGTVSTGDRQAPGLPRVVSYARLPSKGSLSDTGYPLTWASERSSSRLELAAGATASLASEDRATPRGVPRHLRDHGGFQEVKRIYPDNGVKAQKRFNHWLYQNVERLVDLHRDVVMCYHVGAVHLIKMSEYSESSVCAQQARIRPFTFCEREDGHGDLFCGLDHKKFSWEFNGFAEGFAEDDARSSSRSAGSASPASTAQQQGHGLLHAVSAVSLRLLPATAAASAQAWSGLAVSPPAPDGHGCDAAFYSELRLGCVRSDAFTVDVSILPRAAVGTRRRLHGWVQAEAAKWRAELDELESRPTELEAPPGQAVSPDPSEPSSSGAGSQRRRGRGCCLSL